MITRLPVKSLENSEGKIEFVEKTYLLTISLPTCIYLKKQKGKKTNSPYIQDL